VETSEYENGKLLCQFDSECGVEWVEKRDMKSEIKNSTKICT